MRNIVVLIGAVILTVILIFLGEWINLHTTAAREIELEQGSNLPGYYVEHQEEIKRRYGLYFGQLDDKRMQQEEFVIYPSIAVVIAAFVVIFANRRTIMLTGICLLPLLFYVVSNPWWWGRRVPLVPGYLLLGLLVALLVRYLKRRIIYRTARANSLDASGGGASRN